MEKIWVPTLSEEVQEDLKHRGGQSSFMNLKHFGLNYWVSCFAAVFMYGTVIPFLLIGSEFLQEVYG